MYYLFMFVPLPLGWPWRTFIPCWPWHFFTWNESSQVRKTPKLVRRRNYLANDTVFVGEWLHLEQNCRNFGRISGINRLFFQMKQPTLWMVRYTSIAGGIKAYLCKCQCHEICVGFLGSSMVFLAALSSLKVLKSQVAGIKLIGSETVGPITTTSLLYNIIGMMVRSSYPPKKPLFHGLGPQGKTGGLTHGGKLI